MEQSMEGDGTAITSLATVRLQAKSRLFLTACCPDKDLVVLISRVGSGDKMSLWKMQGAKKWEVDLGKGTGAPDEVTAVNWSPDGEPCVFLYTSSLLRQHLRLKRRHCLQARLLCSRIILRDSLCILFEVVGKNRPFQYTTPRGLRRHLLE